ncbi:hypothetical protein OIO90_002345 [Microbotryomycetes sp. JL221]|nr:hypothetical protein OIO90_002345 [Microbotryomycetes sp. JL221]
MRSYTAATVAVALASSCFVNAFSNTSPIIAWSNDRLKSLQLLSPQRPKAQSVFRQPNDQLTLEDASTTTDESDLCTLSTILLVSAPGLHYSDLKYLPAASESNPLSIKSSLHHAMQQRHDDQVASQRAITYPYVPTSFRRGQLSSTEQLVKEFANRCEAVVESDNVKSFWSGSTGKTVRVELVEGLDEWDLTGQDARNARRQIMQNLDATVSGHLQSLYASGDKFLVILVSLPTASTDELVNNLKPRARPVIRKRQFMDDTEGDEADQVDVEVTDVVNEDGDDRTDPSWTEEVIDYVEDAYDDLTNTLSSALAPKKGGKNQTSIFEPKEGSGLLHRYVFFSTPLIIGLALTLLVFIPVTLFTTQALGTTHTLKGLETKMQGSILVDQSKSG